MQRSLLSVVASSVCLVAFVGLLVVTAGGCTQSATQTESQADLKMRVAIDLWPGYYPAVILEAQDGLASSGVDLEVSVPENTDRMMSDFLNGKYDGICVALGDAIDLAAANPDLYWILISDESAGGDALVSGNTFDPASVQPGTKIGTNLGGFGEVFVHEFLERHQLLDKVELVQVDAAQVPEMIATGVVQAAHTWEPYVSQVVDAGGAKWFDSSQTPGLIPDGLIVRGEFARRHPEKLQDFVADWFAAAEWWKGNLAEGNAVIGKQLAIQPTEISLDGILLYGAVDNQQRFLDKDSKDGLPAIIQRYSDFFLQRGVIARPVQARGLIDSRFVVGATEDK